jgi:hypothetical protein
MQEPIKLNFALLPAINFQADIILLGLLLFFQTPFIIPDLNAFMHPHNG